MDISKDPLIQTISNNLTIEGYKKHRRTFEIFSGAIIAINILGANLESSNPLGIPLKNSDRPEMLFVILIIIGAYLLYRYTVAMNIYVYPFLKRYLFDKRKAFISDNYLNSNPTQYKQTEGRWMHETKKKWECLSSKKQSDSKIYQKYESYNYVFQVKTGGGTFENTKEKRSIPIMTRLDLESMFRIELLYKESAIGWDIWMPYYLFALAIGAAVFNYLY